MSVEYTSKINVSSNKLVKWVIIFGLFSIIFIIYRYFNPYNYTFYPECIFYKLTGYKCPGCGSQRAIHYLLNFDIGKTFQENGLLVVSIPYILAYIYLDIIKLKTQKQMRIKKILYGYKAFFVVLLVLIIFGITRNIHF